MKTILLSDHSELRLPEEWTELQPKRRLQAAEWLCAVLAGQMEPFEWQVHVLRLLTGYRPSRRQHIADVSNMVSSNRVRLAETLTFAFSVDDETRTVQLRYDMYDCPVHLGGRRAWQPRFTRDRVISTNLTARQYADGCDLLAMMQDASADDRLWLMRKLTAVLWRTDDGMPLPNPTPGELLLVTVWFTGVALFWQQHPVYSVLYEKVESQKSKVESTIRLGMSEILLELEQRGHHRAAEMLLTDFMDAQVKLLKDRLSDARAHGATTADIVRTTGLSIDTVTRL